MGIKKRLATFRKVGKTHGIKPYKKSMEMEEIGKILIAVLILVVLIFAIWLLIKGKGGDALTAIKNLLRFGR